MYLVNKGGKEKESDDHDGGQTSDITYSISMPQPLIYNHHKSSSKKDDYFRHALNRSLLHRLFFVIWDWVRNLKESFGIGQNYGFGRKT